ncbi:MAG: lysine--tRNA ligase [Candidatus Omnitrophota bacterium]|nr:lysine--tRNA ligase [Candidatus Omnitrophota bacterium]
MEIKDIINQRLEKLNSLKKIGLNPYQEKFLKPKTIALILADFKQGEVVNLAGRIMAIRSHGKVSFFDLQDSSAKIQLYVKSELLSQNSAETFKAIDIGDIAGIKGELFKTHTQEPTVKVTELLLLSKSLRPLPEKWHGLKDIEIRYRKRYIDLIANQDVKKIFELRTRIISLIRKFLDDRGFLEVETPMLQAIPGGARGKPFKSFHNEYDMDVFLRIAPELYLKRLLVGGFEKIYEINRSFRNEGVSTRHNPEFTMLEVYACYWDYEDMMKLCEEIFCFLAKEIFGSLKINYQEKEIDLTPHWQKVSFAKVVKEKFNIDPKDSPEAILQKIKKLQKDISLEEGRLTRSHVMKIVEDLLQESETFNPVFFTDYFSLLSPLAKARIDNPDLSQRFELFVGGIEIANAYTEQNDPIEQRKRFEFDLKEDSESKTIDEDYVEALEYGMPPAGGLGIGIDRLLMLFTNSASIREVILFPLLRPEKGRAE